MLFDIFSILTSFILTWYVLNLAEPLPAITQYLWILLIYGFVLFFTMMIQDAYSRGHFRYRDRMIRNIFSSSLMASLFCVVIFPSMIEVANMQRFLGIFIVLSTSILTVQWLGTTTIVFNQMRKSLQHSLIVGDIENIDRYLFYLGKTSLNEVPIGYVASDCAIEHKKVPCLGVIEDLEEIISHNIIDEVVFAMPHTFVGRVERYMEMCERRGLTVKIALDFERMSHSRSCITSVGPIPVMMYHTVSLNEIQLLIKRIMDIAGALVGLTLTLIASIVIIPAIKLDSPGPAIFKQRRMGKNGRDFMVYKFRSMCTDAEQRKADLSQQNEINDGMMFKIKNDPRITKVGAFLRKTSLDELPQFMNILKGEMSLVGTRPPTMDEVVKYEDYQHRRISIKPGLTGLWQIKGRSKIRDFNEVVRLDVQYIDNWSVWQDISIILHTVWVVIGKKQGAY